MSHYPPRTSFDCRQRKASTNKRTRFQFLSICQLTLRKIFTKGTYWAAEMVPQVREDDTKPEDLVFIIGTYLMEGENKVQ